ncbi:F-box/kelch-repeat protein At1g57790 [Linum grandiflorum]
MIDDDRHRPWSDLLHELCTQVLDFLFGQDIARFRSVCKHWRQTPLPQVRRIRHPHPISEIVKHPLLLSFRSKVASSYGRLYSPTYNKTYFVDALPRIADAQIHCYNYGWLLMSSEDCVFFFLHPATQTIIHLPFFGQWGKAKCFNRMTFSAPPTSRDCMVFGLVSDRCTKKVLISTIRRGDDQWKRYGRLSSNMMIKKKKKNKSFHRHRQLPIPCVLNTPFNSSNFSTPPVFHNGVFYSLGASGRLGVFNPNKKLKWRVLDTVHPSFPANFISEVYLTKSTNGQLISVIVGSRGESNSIKVLRFNEVMEKWYDVTYLKNEVIFLSRPSCMVINCQELGFKELENTIHFPRFDDHHQHSNVFYSIYSKKFHTFDGATKGDLCDTKLPINCAWIIPRDFQPFNDQQLNWSSLVVEPTRIGRREKDHYMSILEKLTFLPPINEVPRWEKTSTSSSSSSTGKPWIVFPHQTQDKQLSTAYVDLTVGTDQYYYSSHEITSIIDRRVFLMSFKWLKGKDVVTSKDGLVFVMDAQGVCILMGISSPEIHLLPMWNNAPINFRRNCCLLHSLSPDHDSKVSVIIFGTVTNPAWEVDAFVIFCTVGDDKWTILKGRPRIMTVVSYEGKIYGFTLEDDSRFVEIEIQPNAIRTTTLFEVPFYFRPTGCFNFIKKLVESCGELLYFEMYLYGYDGGEDIIADIKVYKINFKTEQAAGRLQELENFGDRAFFFSNKLDCVFGCCASKFGLKANTIYYISTTSNKLYKYDYGDRSISFSIYCPNIEEAFYRNKLFMYC